MKRHPKTLAFCDASLNKVMRGQKTDATEYEACYNPDFRLVPLPSVKSGVVLLSDDTRERSFLEKKARRPKPRGKHTVSMFT